VFYQIAYAAEPSLFSTAKIEILVVLTEPPTAVNDFVETAIGDSVIIPVLDNDILLAPVELTIVQGAANGTASVSPTNPDAISYEPVSGFYGSDSLVYQIAYAIDPSLFSTAKIYINVVDDSGIDDMKGISGLTISPNPATDHFNISFDAIENSNLSITVFDLKGKTLLQKNLQAQAGNNHFTIRNHQLAQGIYLLKLNNNKESGFTKLIVK
jgi:hypothetical protein